MHESAEHWSSFQFKPQPGSNFPFFTFYIFNTNSASSHPPLHLGRKKPTRKENNPKGNRGVPGLLNDFAPIGEKKIDLPLEGVATPVPTYFHVFRMLSRELILTVQHTDMDMLSSPLLVRIWQNTLFLYIWMSLHVSLLHHVVKGPLTNHALFEFLSFLWIS